MRHLLRPPTTYTVAVYGKRDFSRTGDPLVSVTLHADGAYSVDWGKVYGLARMDADGDLAYYAGRIPPERLAYAVRRALDTLESDAQDRAEISQTLDDGSLRGEIATTITALGGLLADDETVDVAALASKLESLAAELGEIAVLSRGLRKIRA